MVTRLLVNQLPRNLSVKKQNSVNSSGHYLMGILGIHQWLKNRTVYAVSLEKKSTNADVFT